MMSLCPSDSLVSYQSTIDAASREMKWRGKDTFTAAMDFVGQFRIQIGLPGTCSHWLN